ncbi:MAG: nuclear transport factor 2 family protein [Bacteroidota bacterium]
MKETIEKFYQSFHELDAEGMAAYYHDDIVFTDPAFGTLKGEHAGNMWRMLCDSQKGKDFRIEFSDVSYENGTGSARWQAYYTFSRTGRRVHNIIQARFKFEGDKIIEHVDHFNLHRWSRQALGFMGLLLGWSGGFKKKLNAQTNKLLADYEKNQKQ